MTDADYADDIVLMSDTLQDAQTLLHRVEEAALDVGLSINTKKTKAILIGQEDQNLYTLDGNNIETVEDFQYLGVWIVDYKKEVRTRKAKAWSAMLNLNRIWRSDMNRRLTVNFFKAAVESILLYCSECWTLTKEEEHRLDGCYTRLLRHALGISWRDHVTNEELYGDLPKISDVVRRRRLQFAGHCARSDELAADAVLWQPNGNRNRGRPAHTYRRLLEKDTGLCTQELRTAMLSRTNWRYRVMGSGEPPDWLIDSHKVYGMSFIQMG